MKTVLKTIGWFWIILGLLGMLIAFKWPHRDFVDLYSIIFCTIWFVLSGAGLLHGNLLAWCSTVLMSGLFIVIGIIRLITGVDTGADFAISVFFIILFAFFLVTIYQNRLHFWRLSKASELQANRKLLAVLYGIIFVGATAICIINMRSAISAGANENELKSIPNITIPFGILFIQILFAASYATVKLLVVLVKKSIAMK